MGTLKGFSRLIVGFDMDFSVNRSPLKTIVSRKVISFSDISAVNLIVGWTELLASLIKSSTSFLLLSQREKTSSM